MSAMNHRAERLRVARVLGVDVAELEFLSEAPVEALAELRNGIQDRLLESSRAELERAVALAGKIPARMAATLAHKAMGPVLGGRAASLLEADMAVELASRLPAEFLADVSRHVDLRHVGPLVGGIPVETMVAAGQVLRAREEWIVLSAFVGYVPTDKLRVLLDVFDGEALLRSAFVIEDVSRVDSVLALLSDARLDELLIAADVHGLWEELVALSGFVSPAQAERIVAAIERLPEAALADLTSRLKADPSLRAAASPLIELAPGVLGPLV